MADKQIRNEYRPDFVSPPGETLQETLEALGMTQSELAARTGRSEKTISQIINGKAPITTETALQLEYALDVPASFWNRREQQYRESLTRIEERERLEANVGWLDELPVDEMIDRGWVDYYEDAVDQLREVLDYFGVVSPEQWRTTWGTKPLAAFRTSPAFRSDPPAVAAWLRRGELLAQQIECAPYDTRRFKAVLGEVRALTRDPVSQAVNPLVERCASAGVAVVFVPALEKTRVSGATRWLKADKALIQLSLRYKSDDHLWFSFFHEAGHIILHGKRDVFLEEFDGDGPADKEREADAFARDALIPPKQYDRFVDEHRDSFYSKDAIRVFADRIGIAPGIVVGRLQHDRHLEYSHCNDLKRTLEWNADEEVVAV